MRRSVVSDEPSQTPSILRRAKNYFRILCEDKFAFTAAAFLVVLILCAIFGPMLLDDAALRINLRGRNVPPFSLDRGWLFILGSDNIGRSILARLIVGSQNTLGIAFSAVACAFIVGGVLGLIAGYVDNWVSKAILRLADILMSFPSMLLALIVLYVLAPSVLNLVLILTLSRVPIYLRTCRAEVLEVRERLFVQAANVMGSRTSQTLRRHVVPMVLPSLATVATLELAFVMLSESGLSFLGLGVQPPGITWGLMVADGRGYLATAWWLSFWPGLAITLTAVSVNLLSGWLRTVMDPMNSWRLAEGAG